MYPCSIFSAFQQFSSFFCVTLPIFSILLQDAGTRKPHWSKTESEVNIRFTDIKWPLHSDSLPPCLCPKSWLSFPAGTWHRKHPRATRPFWSPCSHTGDYSGHSLPSQITFRTCLSRFINLHLSAWKWFGFNNLISQTNCIHCPAPINSYNSPNVFHLHILPVMSHVFFCITE